MHRRTGSLYIHNSLKRLETLNTVLRWLSASARARAAVTAQQRENDTRLPEDLEFIPNVPYTAPDGAALAADIYRPAGNHEPLPVVVMVHGGGLFAGDRRINSAFSRILAGKGYLVFSIDYRVIDETDGCGEISDVSAGFSFVCKNMAAYGGNPQRVCVMAESAGAFLAVYAAALTRSAELAAVLGCTPSELPIRAFVCFSGMFYTTKHDLIGAVYRSALYGPRRRDKGFMRHMNPEHADVISNLPPVLLTSSSADFLRRYTLGYAKALRENGHPCKLLYYKHDRSLIHAFPSLKPELPQSAAVLEVILQWLDSLSQPSR